MRRFYSFMLMATMLFIGANAWAATKTVGISQVNPDYTSVKAAVEDAAAGDVIKLISAVTESNPIWINKNLTLDLQDFTWTYSGTGSVAIGLTSGTLTVKGAGEGKILANSVGDDLIRIYGTYEKINAKTSAPYVQLVIEQGATIQSGKNAISIDVMRKGQAAKFGKTDADFANKSCNFFEHTGASGYGVANGVKVEIAGAVKANKYGIKCNGTVRNGKEYATMNPLKYEYTAQQGSYTVDANNDENYSPYIHVASTGNIETMDPNSAKAVAVYASGYARWLIEGACAGSSGVYVKSGDVDINGATVSSNYEGTYDPILATENTASGVLGAGSAVAVESNQNYSGDIDVTISGGATLTAGTGYALEESVAASTGTKVDAISVEGATFTSGNTSAGAITISETTSEAAANPSNPATIVVTSAEVTGSITIGDPTQGEAKLDDFTSTSAVIPASGTQPTIIVPLDIQLTSDGFASFSAPIDLYKATGKDGYKAFGIYTGVLSNDVLQLTEVNYVKAGVGVILYSTVATKCYFTTTPDGSSDNYVANDLKASADWDPTDNHDAIYCLRNVTGETMLYKYLGANMPDNKAYLDLGNNNNAPARIRMVIAGTQDIENVANEAVKAQKFIENGNIFIKRGEKVFNVQGQIVK